MRLTEQDIAAFATWSRDRNPLHVDADFARKTYFGRPIVHGALVVLAALEEAAPQLQGFSFNSLDIEFRGAVVTNADYQVSVQFEPTAWLVTVAGDGGTLLTIRGDGRRTDAPSDLSWIDAATVPARETPATHSDHDLRHGVAIVGEWQPGEDRRRSPVLSAMQADVLALCSYIVGMEVPGLHSLFTRATLQFHSTAGADAPLRFRATTNRFDVDFRLLECHVDIVSTGGTLAATARLRSYVPFVVGPPNLDVLTARLSPEAPRLHGKVALVCGAARGLGLDVSVALALAGAHVYSAARHDDEQAIQTRGAVSERGGHIEFVAGDVGDSEWCDRISATLAARHGGIDILVLNACAPPESVRISAQSSLSRAAYVADNLRLVETPLAAFASLLDQRGGTVAYVSSAAVDAPPPGWGAYVAVKQAGEGLVRTAVRERPRIAALIARPPALRTRWSNTPAAAAAAIPSDQAASHVVNHLANDVRPGEVDIVSAFPAFSSDAQPVIPTGEPDLTIRAVSTFTADPIVAPLRRWLNELDIHGVIELGPYAQVVQSLLDPSSLLFGKGRAINVLLLRPADWLRELAPADAESVEFVQAHLASAAIDLEQALRAHRSRATTETLVVLCPSVGVGSPAIASLVSETEQRLQASLSAIPGVQLCSAREFHGHYDVRDDAVRDELRDHIGHIPYTDDYFDVLAAIVARRVFRRTVPPRKVVVVDCDNTLWRGVVGEVGPEGIEFDEEHVALHDTLVRLSASGVVICLCSKNEESDVWDVFDSRPDLRLRREHIVAARINWHRKSENLTALAAGLNLGLDSFVFVDDNPVECADVRTTCPDVLTLQWPLDTAKALALVRHTWEFDPVAVTKEDAQRTQMYREEFRRQELQAQTLTFADFIDRLELAIDIDPLVGDDVRRASQLTLRTNQFNFTTIRREEADLQALAADSHHSVRTVRVRDRFGDYGLVGLLIAHEGSEEWTVDTFLLSCRVLGRGVEHHILADVGRRAADAGVPHVRLRIVRTKRNTPAVRFLQGAVPPHFLHDDGQVVECVMPARALADVRFEPSSAEMPAEEEATPLSTQSPSSEGAIRVRRREAQIYRAAFELSRVVSSHPEGGAEQVGGSHVAPDEIATIVCDAFGAALRVSADTVRRVDNLEALGCDSMRIVEITVALSARFPSLPSTLLFEHRSVSQIVAAIGAMARSRDAAPAIVARAATAPSDATDRLTDIAVVGMDLRCGGANSPEELWELLSNGRRAIAPVPASRPFFLRPLNDARTHWAALLQDVDLFDAEFFGISPREAEAMDPQGRLLLQTAWGALEDAGCAGREHEPETGVFIGVMYGDYGRTVNGEAPADSPYKCWEGFSVANRLSQALDLRGPSLAIDTACSSSGTALHLACRALADGDCRVAIVGGINLILDPDRFSQLGRLGILSPTGRVDAFGAEADGTVLGEGVGVVVLRPLHDALARNDRIYGVIKGTGVSTGSGTVGFTAPNPVAQADAIRRAVAAARIDPRTIGYVETHGTGTSLGDPIEVRGLTIAYGDSALHDRALRGTQRCRIGSVKPNIGHLEAGAGVISLIKILLQLQHRSLLPSLASTAPNPQIPFADVPFQIQRALEPWQSVEFEIDGVRRPVPRRAGMSSFGVGGANAHVIIEEAPSTLTAPAAIDRSAHVLTLSARSDESLRQLASATARALTDDSYSLPDVAYTLNTGRKHFDRRLAVTAASAADAAAVLDRAASGHDAPGCWQGRAPLAGGAPRIAFLFTGQGSQYAGMGQMLYETQPVFRDALDRCAAHLDAVLGRSLLEVLFADPASPDAQSLDQTGFTQPALFALQYALAQLWQSWGVTPHVVMGHSVGEIAALCVARGISLEDGARLIAARGRLMQALPAGGAMTSVMASEAIVSEALSRWSDQVAVAAVNAPEQIVISGAAAAVAELTSQFVAQGIKTKPLTVSHAFHSPLMRPMVSEFQAVVASIRFAEPRIPFVSCVTGERAAREITSPEYWVRQVLDPVRFTSGIAAVERTGASGYLEIGPHPVLLGMARQCVDTDDRLWLPSLRKDTDAWQTILGSVASLHVNGAEIDWPSFDGPYVRRRVSLPRYRFRQKRYWVEPRTAVPTEAMSSGQRTRTPGTSRYAVEWRKHQLSAVAKAETDNTHWIVLPDSGDVAPRLIAALSARRASVVRLEANVDAGLQRIVDVDTRATRVVDLRWLDLPSDPCATDQARHLRAVVDAVNALAGSKVAQRRALWLVSRGVQSAIGDEPCTAGQASLWGFGRTLALELPELDGGLIDLPRHPETVDIESLADALLRASSEDQLALRGADVYVPRLVSAGERRDANPHAFSRDGSYLITGGLGALGQHTARWLADRGVRHIVLASRHPATHASGTLVSTLAERGITVRVETADVSREADVARLIGRFGTEFPPLRGIVHAAGVERAVPIRDLTVDELVSTLAVKVDGARLLDRHTRDLSLDTFVCFSSMASVLGLGHRAAYAAANAYLDALAFERRSHGAAALTINWGPWAGGGMASPDLLREFESIGNHGLTADEALRAVDEALRDASPQAVIADVDWDRFRSAYEARKRRPIVSALTDVSGTPAAPTPPGRLNTNDAQGGEGSRGDAEWASTLAALSPADRATALSSLLRHEVAATLGFAAPDEVPVDGNFYQLGMDSLMTAELIARLRKRTGMSCAPLVFDYPSVQALTPKLVDALAEAIETAVRGTRERDRLPHETAKAAEASPITGYSDRDDRDLLEFQTQMFAERDRELLLPRWRWMVVDSAGRIGVEPRAWLYRDRDRLVAHMAAIHARLKIDAREHNAAWLVDTMVLEQYRPHAIGLRLMAQAQEDLACCLSLGQSAEVRDMLFRLGWKQVTPLHIAQLLIRPENVLKRKLGGAGAWVAGVGLRVAAAARGLPEISADGVRQVTRFDARHDVLWHAMADGLTCAVTRDASFLNWKYVDQPGQEYLRLELVEDGIVRGVAILMFRDADPVYSYRRAFLVDLVAPLADGEVLRRVIAMAIVAASDRGADSLACMHTDRRLTDALKACGFRLRTPQRFLLVDATKLPDSDGALLTNADAWHVMHGDSDIDRPGRGLA